MDAEVEQRLESATVGVGSVHGALAGEVQEGVELWSEICVGGGEVQ